MKHRMMILISSALLAAPLLISSCKSKDEHKNHETSAPAAKTIYHCPMHPQYTSDRPGDCPICGMKLVPVSEEQHQTEVPSGTSVQDRASITISEDRRQMIGVRTAPATRRSLENIVRASGRVAYDPELYNAIVEYQEAMKAMERVRQSPLPDVQKSAGALVRSSALRLRQMGLSEGQISRLQAETENPTNLLLSEKGGSVWVYAQIYEFESGQVKSGQMMEVTSPSLGSRALKGRVVAVDSILNPETRTLRVRGEVPNTQGLLKPEMYVDALIHVSLGEQLAVPKEAVLDSGQRKIVFVESAPGKYDPREIHVGREAEGYYEVVSGLKEGENIVTSANFLIDSESKLKSALSQTGAGHQH